MSIMIDTIKLEEEHLSELGQKTRVIQQLGNQIEALSLATDEYDASIQSRHTESSEVLKQQDESDDSLELHKLKQLLYQQSRQLQK